jgi:hypothetical protein
MEIEKKESRKRHVVVYIVMTLIIGLLAYHIYKLEEEKELLKIESAKKEILGEYKLLNAARINELNKSMVTLKLLECKGVKRHVIDSITIHLFVTNESLIRRDSAFIKERYEKLKQ